MARCLEDTEDQTRNACFQGAALYIDQTFMVEALILQAQMQRNKCGSTCFLSKEASSVVYILIKRSLFITSKRGIPSGRLDVFVFVSTVAGTTTTHID